MTKFTNKCKNFFLKSGLMTTKDYMIMGTLTLIFTIMVFFRLGNLSAPQSFYTSTESNRDIVIDFGNYIDVEKLYIYNGNQSSRKIALSAFNEVSGAWEIINSDVEVGSVFQWNTVNIYYNLRYLGIVCTSTDEDSVFGEFVFTDKDKVILPVNANDYPELFDEQDEFFDTTEKTYMDGTYFDEVYHARTGYEFVHGLPTYETTHPQLGKCLIALFIKIFGMTPFGWRFASALFGIFFVPLMYIFAKALFKDTFVATAVGMFITFDCMHYSLSRIATIDIFVAFFIVLSYYFMYKYITINTEYHTKGITGPGGSKILFNPESKFPPSPVWKPLMFCAIFIGCAVSTKLTGVYAAFGLVVLLVANLIKYMPRKQTFRLFLFCFGFFIVWTMLIYTLAYIPVVEKYAQIGITDKTIEWNEDGLNIAYGWTGLIPRTLRNTNYMINYHKDLVATHPYSSAWYEWPIMWTPLFAASEIAYYQADAVGNWTTFTSSISHMGNIIIWFSLIPCFFYMVYRTIFKKDEKAGFLLIALLSQYLPWVFISRVTFIYHYFPTIIFGMLMIGYTIKLWINENILRKRLVILCLMLVVVFFLLFFPVISGLPVDRNYALSLKWFPKWALVS